ncbi:MAG: N-formylglutamate amidohydrolase [Verrucomicrobiaceae bacterium]
MKLVLSAEHAGNIIPPPYRHLFPDQSVLNTHLAYDPGTAALFDHLAPLTPHHHRTSVSRLLIEANRSLHHPKLFSSHTTHLSKAEKQTLIGEHYLPYRNAVQTDIRTLIQAGEHVLHLSLHSFTPQLNGHIRACDLALLYDPSRIGEKNLSSQFLAELHHKQPRLRLRKNFPYRGTADGFTTALRKTFPSAYLGIELEINQALIAQKSPQRTRLFNTLSSLLSHLCDPD